jgi:hypothetical protein
MNAEDFIRTFLNKFRIDEFLLLGNLSYKKIIKITATNFQDIQIFKLINAKIILKN